MARAVVTRGETAPVPTEIQPPKLVLNIIPLANKERSRQIVFTVFIKNDSNNRIELIEIVPNKPAEADFVDISLISDAAIVAKHEYLERISRLSTALMVNLNWRYFLSYYFSNMLRPFIPSFAFKSTGGAVNAPYTFQSADQAKRFLMKVVGGPEAPRATPAETTDAKMGAGEAHKASRESLRRSGKDWNTVTIELLRYNIFELENIEKDLETRPQRHPIIRNGEQVEANYVVSFPRAFLSSIYYKFGVTVRYAKSDNDGEIREIYLDSKDETVVIPPSPFWVSAFAALFAIFANMSRFMLDIGSQSGTDDASTADAATNGSKNTSNIQALWDALTSTPTGQALTAALLAIVVFNVYDRTPLNDKIDAGTSWRGALLIGALSGLFTSKFVDVLEALISTSR